MNTHEKSSACEHHEAAAEQEQLNHPVPPVEAETKNDASSEITLKVNRQTLIIVSLVILLIISALETVQLSRLHRAIGLWQTLPTAASTTVPAPAVSGPAANSALPSQVGGC